MGDKSLRYDSNYIGERAPLAKLIKSPEMIFQTSGLHYLGGAAVSGESYLWESGRRARFVDYYDVTKRIVAPTRVSQNWLGAQQPIRNCN